MSQWSNIKKYNIILTYYQFPVNINGGKCTQYIFTPCVQRVKTYNAGIPIPIIRFCKVTKREWVPTGVQHEDHYRWPHWVVYGLVSVRLAGWQLQFASNGWAVRDNRECVHDRFKPLETESTALHGALWAHCVQSAPNKTVVLGHIYILVVSSTIFIQIHTK